MPQPFGRWLIGQSTRDNYIGALAKQALRDPAFPKDGDPDQARKRLSYLGADGDAFEALEDAEREWLAH